MRTATNPDGTVDFDKFRENYIAMLDDMKTVLFERDDEIWGLGLAAIGKLNVFNLGIPGLAKSLLPREFVARIADMSDEDFFDLQFRRNTLPEEVFGPFSLKAMQEDRLVRNPDRRLPHCRIFLGDEAFKASSPVLNGLLRAMQEGTWENDGRRLPLPMWFAIWPSNECPVDAEFAAIRDRLHLSYQSEAIKSDANFLKMISLDPNREIEQFVSVSEVEAAQKEVHKVEFPDECKHLLAGLRQNLNNENVVLSDRRYVKAVQVLRTNAWLNGRSEIEQDDFRVLEHVMWVDPEEKAKVKSIVLELASPIDLAASEVLDIIRDLGATYDRQVRSAANHDERIRHAMDLNTGLFEAKNKIDDIVAEERKANYKSKLLRDAVREHREQTAKFEKALKLKNVELEGMDE